MAGSVHRFVPLRARSLVVVRPAVKAKDGVDQQDVRRRQQLSRRCCRAQEVIDDDDVARSFDDFRTQGLGQLRAVEDPLQHGPLLFHALPRFQLELRRKGPVHTAGCGNAWGVRDRRQHSHAMPLLREQPPKPERDLRSATRLPCHDQGLHERGDDSTHAPFAIISRAARPEAVSRANLNPHRN